VKCVLPVKDRCLTPEQTEAEHSQQDRWKVNRFPGQLSDGRDDKARLDQFIPRTAAVIEPPETLEMRSSFGR
jgi:hypothetical protein